MTVNKITTPPTQQEQINKINEIIDNLGGSVAWGNISGTLSNQTDLQNALDEKTLVTFREWS